MKLIVNADDYGLTAGVSAGIRQAYLGGIVRSTTVMMNHPAAITELPLAQELCPGLGLGVHLTLTAGEPILSAGKVSSLVNPEGRFYHQNELVARLERINLDQVDAEWHAQVERFMKVTGQIPDHLDSHHHSSYFSPALFEHMLRLAEELRRPIRNPFADDSHSPGDYLLACQAESGLAEIARLLRRYSIEKPDHFFSGFYDKMVSLPHLHEILRQIADLPSNQCSEIMCHPGLMTDDLRQISGYQVQREKELNVLTDPGLPEMLRTLAIELGSF